MNIAFVGFRHAHIMGLYEQCLHSDEVNVIGAFEEDEAARKAAMDTVKVPFYSSYEDLLKNENVEAVAVGDYYGIRGQRIIKALEAGKHIIADKPICTSLDELADIAALSQRNSLKVCCMLDLRYGSAMRTAKRMIEEGKLGRIHAVNFTGQHPLNWGTRPGWYFEEGKHGGTVNDLAIHGVDAIRYLTGKDYVRTIGVRTWNAFADKAPEFKDCAQFIAEFEDGIGITADVSYSVISGLPASMPGYWRFTVWGTEGTLEFRYGDNELVYASNASKKIEMIPADEVTDSILSDFLKPYDKAEVENTLLSCAAVLNIQKCADA